MQSVGLILLTLGAILFIGFATDELGRRTRLPRVTLLLIFGVLIGPSVFNLLPEISFQWLPLVTDMALLMVGFLLGERLSFSKLSENGRYVFFISVTEALVTCVSVTLGLWLLGLPMGVAILLGAIAAASAPAATLDVIEELKISNKFVDTLEGIVAVDDAWGLILFGFALALVELAVGVSPHNGLFFSGLKEVGGSILLGFCVGAPMAFLTGRIRPGSPTQVEALALVFICGGLAEMLGVSFLLAALSMGATVANLAKHHEQPFHAIENIERPFLILFFVLAGAALHLGSLWELGLIGLVYMFCRILGKLLGCYLSARTIRAPMSIQRWMGLALTPQAGVAMGMALIAADRFPAHSTLILPVVVGTTVIFELLGPVATRCAVLNAQEKE